MEGENPTLLAVFTVNKGNIYSSLRDKHLKSHTKENTVPKFKGTHA